MKSHPQPSWAKSATLILWCEVAGWSKKAKQGWAKKMPHVENVCARWAQCFRHSGLWATFKMGQHVPKTRAQWVFCVVKISEISRSSARWCHFALNIFLWFLAIEISGKISKPWNIWQNIHRRFGPLGIAPHFGGMNVCSHQNTEHIVWFYSLYQSISGTGPCGSPKAQAPCPFSKSTKQDLLPHHQYLRPEHKWVKSGAEAKGQRWVQWGAAKRHKNN